MIKYLSLFSGIGAFEKALQRLHVPYELVGYSEIDKYARKAYSLLHKIPESMNFGDITQIDERKLQSDIDLITYGFPCQDISLAGQQMGLFDENGEKTRSGLFFDALRIIEHCKPKIAIAENVKNLTSKRFDTQFHTVLKSLESAGYNNYWKILNAKDYEIPQSRERVFIVSIRKDVDTGVFEFPKSVPRLLNLKDLLEGEVNEKYFLSDKMKNYLFDITEKNKARHNGNIYRPVDIEGVCRAITTKEGSRVKDNFIEYADTGKIRRLTPKECFRLMGFDDYDVDFLIKNGISDTQLYKMAGNSIVVNVLEFLFCQIFDNNDEIWV